MRRLLNLAWTFLHALADRVRFYAACVRESDVLDTCLLIVALLALIGGALACSGVATWYCEWRAAR